MKSKIIEALIIEVGKDIILSDGNEKSLTKVVTVDGSLLSIWHDDNQIHGKANEEVFVVVEESAKLKDDGTPYLNYAIIPAAFAAKIVASKSN